MNELTIPLTIKAKVGKTEIKYPLGESTLVIKAKYKTSLVVGIFWLSFKIFFMGIKKAISLLSRKGDVNER